MSARANVIRGEGPPRAANRAPAFGGSAAASAASVGVVIRGEGPPRAANRAPAFGGSAAASAASVGVVP
jgi:hypothetical protein